MKHIYTFIIVLLATSAFGQSKSYQVLRDRFRKQPEVHSFSINGILCRAAVAIALNDEDEDHLRKAVREIRHVRFMVIPKEEFRNQGLTVNGFRGYLKKDLFDEMVDVRDQDDHVTFYHRSDGNKKDRYFVLVEETDDVVAIELKGHLDPEMFVDEDSKIITR